VLSSLIRRMLFFDDKSKFLKKWKYCLNDEVKAAVEEILLICNLK